MTKVGIRELKNSLSKYVQRAAAGERLLVTDHGKVVATLGPAVAVSDDPDMARYNELVAAGVIRPATQKGPFFKGMRTLRLPKGTAARLIDEGREENF